MASGDQLARQWRIIQTVVSSKHGKTVADLVKEENCHPRTVYCDLEALQEAGFPIYSERVYGKGLWSVVDVYKHKMPVPFTLTELMALHFRCEEKRKSKGAFGASREASGGSQRKN